MSRCMERMWKLSRPNSNNALHEGDVTAPKHIGAILMHEGGADKFLARPGRKQATATKRGIYSPYSPRSSIHFLASCSNFCKPLKEKKIRKLSVQPGLCGCHDLRVLRKMAKFQLIFSVQGIGGSPTWSNPENTVGYQETGSPNRPVSSGLQVPGEPWYYRARTTPPPWWPTLSTAFFLQNILQLHQPAEMSNTPRW